MVTPKKAALATPKVAVATPDVAPVTQVVAAATDPAADAPVIHFLIRSHVEGFRRAGRPWSNEQVQVCADEFTPEQIKALLTEPNLVVLPVAAVREEAGE